MTIHEFANLNRLRKRDVPEEMDGAARQLFPAADTDVLHSEDGKLFIAINRKTLRFAGRRGGNFVSGFATDELRAEQVAGLMG